MCGLLTSSSRTGPSTGAISIKDGRVISSFVWSCTFSVFNHQNGQTALYVALLCPFGVISSLRGVTAEGLHSDASRRIRMKAPPRGSRGGRR